MAILELSVPFGRAPPSFSCIPLSQCNRRAVCCRERSHVIVFGKIAILSPERALNGTRRLYFEKCSQVFLYGAILGFVKSHGVSPIPSSSTIGFTVVKNTACLPLARLVPPGINPHLIMDSFHLHSRRG